MPRRSRLDAELVRRGLAGSRERAVELVNAGLVKVGGSTATKPATAVHPGAALIVDEPADPAGRYASRGGHKLAGALDAFAAGGLTVTSRRCLDAGASTGGFTDVLLRRGATSVLAVDVGYGQLVWALQTDPRVRVLDRTNVRNLEPDDVGTLVDVVVADLSFISLGLVLPALRRCALATADFVLMVKPQFEVGRERLGTGGVVRDPQLRASAVAGVAAQAQALGLGTAGVVASGLPGPAGNVEYFLWLQAAAAPLQTAALEHAVATGPQ
ncbi:MAG: TlyA family RNA methyltransferase [Actinomycetota bacterium]|nr:TlyA family RNA methyltransferase [Actinomycetota bacterium]